MRTKNECKNGYDDDDDVDDGHNKSYGQQTKPKIKANI